ncbi:formylglycine-generating enzyme family protein [Aureliella helgolandensis]|uniref:Serine/threonine-protein kinase pkn1 n=1 Tax=Aureliella helgolandensis TaxID=2527968 RepID=A0A518GF88_9BACT|nr:SUMF1/EgtB/PvdO family nonheme iron enzyme [Aureliella helgolandensis]QDV27259.1 Serine/threonine-protein kinase pkn1 [Aureliella helgolandensis]
MRIAITALLCTCWIGTAHLASGADTGLEKLGFSAEKPAVGASVAVEGGFLVPYTLTIPGTAVEIDMVPVPGGTFKMGSSPDAEGHREDEAPQVEVEVGPMWVAKCETSWAEYKMYMSMYKLFKDLESRGGVDTGVQKINESNLVDAVTAPTELYDSSFTFEFGQDDKLPAVTMTQYSAKQYTKWLSKLTGHQYRLPTEAEWEYACRAGSTTAYHFGDDVDQLDEFAWYYENSDESPHTVGGKQPNPFGLHDMHGNVMEWVIDSYSEEGYAAIAVQKQPMSLMQSVRWPESVENRVVRGGSFQDDAEFLRSAARLGSADEDWKTEDPNVPLSPWWYTTDPARGVGFRIFRSYAAVNEDDIKKFWDIDHEDIEFDVEMRLTEGRGVQVAIDPALAKQIEAENK